MTIRDIVISFGYKVDGASQQKVQNAVNGLKSMATRALSAIGIGFSLVQMNKLIEEWYQVDKVLVSVSTELKNQEAVQNEILKAANGCRIAYSEMAKYAIALVKTGSQFFGTVEDAADFLELANRAFKVSGASESQIASLNNVMQQAFTTGKLSAGGFNTIMSQSPDIVNYLAESLGVSLQQVKALGLSGNITAKQLYAAFQNSSAGINEAYENLELTIADSLQMIRNEFGTWLAQSDEAIGITNFIAKLLLRAFRSLLSVLKTLMSWFERLVDLLGSTQRAVVFLATTFGAIILAFKWQSIVSGLKNIAGALAGVNLKLLAIIGIVLLVILVLDDLIAFMQGDASFLGSFFEKMGIDGEQFRQVLQQIFDAFKKMLSTIMPVLQRLVNSVLPVLQRLLQVWNTIQQKIAEVIMDVLVWALGIVVKILELLMPIVEMLCEFLDQIIDLIMPIIDAVMELIDAVMDLIEPLLELITDILKPIMSIISVLVDALGSQLGNAFKFLGNIVTSVLNGPLRGILDFLQQLIKFITSVFTGDWDSAWKALGNIPIAIINSIIGGFESLINFFVNAINSITAGLSSLWTWIGIPAIPEIPQVQFGRISYLAEGGYIEKNKPTPVVIGDNKEEGEIVSPVSKMRETVIDALRAFIGNDSSLRRRETAQTLQQQSVNKSITQNVNIYNTFEGSKDVQRTTSTAMRKSSRDITDELADAIAYMR